MDGPPELDDAAQRALLGWALLGLLGYPILAWALVVRLSFPVAEGFLLAALLELLPVLAIVQVPLVGRAPVERIPAYVGSGILISVLGGVAAIVGVRRFGSEGVGLSWPSGGVLLSWTALLLALAGLVLISFRWLRERFDLPESPLLRELLPRTRRERVVFVLLAFAAGLGEELAFRGYLLPALAPHLGGVWGAALFGSLTFGLLHAYQGMLGMARTALLGFVFAVSLVLTGSLWPAIFAHVLVDLGGGLVYGERLAR